MGTIQDQKKTRKAGCWCGVSPSIVLPMSDWEEHHADGKMYYYNKVTGESQWTKPAAMMCVGWAVGLSLSLLCVELCCLFVSSLYLPFVVLIVCTCRCMYALYFCVLIIRRLLPPHCSPLPFLPHRAAQTEPVQIMMYDALRTPVPSGWYGRVCLSVWLFWFVSVVGRFCGRSL
jgi:hypothetical protein